MVTHPWDGGEPQGSFAKEVSQLETLSRTLRRCPQCGWYYAVEYERDSDHYMANDSYEIVRRMVPAEAGESVKAGERARFEARYPRQMAAVSAALSSGHGGHIARLELARAVAWDRIRSGDIAGVRALIGDGDDSLRAGVAGALKGVTRSLSFGSELLGVAVDLVDTDPSRRDAGAALHPQCFNASFRPALPALVDRLDHESPWTRGLAAMLVGLHARKAPEFEVSPELRQRVPILERHAAAPRAIRSLYGGTPPTTQRDAESLLQAIKEHGEL